MDVMTERARELLAYQAELDGHVETAAAYRAGMFDTNPSVRALLVALTMAERFESQAVAAIEAAQIASRRADRAGRTAPEGYVLVPVEPTDRMIGEGILAYDGKCESSYRAMLAARPEVP